MYRLNVYDATQKRLKIIFDYFDYVYVSFSGGKDSGVLLNLCIEYIRKYAPGRKLGVFHIDYEIQYQQTTEYVKRTLSKNQDILEVFHCCVPFKVTTCTSMFQRYWRPWESSHQELWARDMPQNCLTQDDFEFYTEELWDYDFQKLFIKWLRKKTKSRHICCLVGIRTQESFNRWRSIHSDKNYKRLLNYKWTHKTGWHEYNAYPIFDWNMSDIWVANGYFNWDYNHLYDLYYQAGIPLARQRVASPFISEAISTLAIYKTIDPYTWAKMIGRVNGVGCAGLYGNSSVMGWRKITCPSGFSWKHYMEFLLETLPEEIRNNYIEKLNVSIKFWREKGGCLSEKTIEKLRKAGIAITVEETSVYHTNKKTVRMEYLDTIDIPEFREIPSYKRMCICIMKNDHTCKYMGFSQNKRIDKYEKMLLINIKNGMKSKFVSPVYTVKAIPIDKVVANSYNPNIVAPPEMKLLELSIWEDGYTMPCVCYHIEEKDLYEIVDGYHRYMVMKTSQRIYDREKGLLPVVVINKDISNRMASTIRHNRARGSHCIELMSSIVSELVRSGMSDNWIRKNIGMDRDELLRLKQITGLAELFANKNFSFSDDWEDEM